MSAAKPSLELLRSLTDEHVLRTLMRHRRATRAEIAAHTDLSKPTVSDAVHRLTETGILAATGERTTGRGRSGSYYTLEGAGGRALLAAVRPDGVAAEAVNAFGEITGSTHVELGRTAGRESAARALAEAAHTLRGGTDAFKAAVVSAADPVDRESGRLVHLPDQPFLVGDLDPVAALGPCVSGPVLVDNDVNWAARAERDTGCAVGIDDFVYVHLGEGLGAAVVSDGEVRRGGSGLGGEIAHLITAGPDGRAMPFTEVFAVLGLRRPGSTAIDVGRLRAALARDGAAERRTRSAVEHAVSGVLAAAIAFTDPRLVVVGGPWGADPAMVSALAAAVAQDPRTVPVAAAEVPEPELAGARTRAVEELRRTVIAAAAGTASRPSGA